MALALVGLRSEDIRKVANGIQALNSRLLARVSDMGTGSTCSCCFGALGKKLFGNNALRVFVFVFVQTTEIIHPLSIFNIASTTNGKKSKLQMYEILGRGPA